jgi:Crp-like helix-turn-helix domain
MVGVQGHLRGAIDAKCMRSDSFSVTHTSLAEAIGVVRSVVTQTMLKFRQEGWVGAERNRITIIKREKLKYPACSCHTFVSREIFLIRRQYY